MKVTVEKTGACRRMLRVEVPAEAVDVEYQKVLGTYSRLARVPGFRPGRAPAPVVEKHYGKAIDEETRDALVPQFYRQALESEKIDPVAIVDVLNVHYARRQPLTFDVLVDVPPDFALPDYKGIPVERTRKEIGPTQVDEAIRHLQERMGTFEDAPAGHRAVTGDLLRIDYEGTVGGQPVADQVGEKFKSMGSGKDFWVFLGQHEFLPGLSKGLEQAVNGETRPVTIEFPAAFHVAELAGKQALYTVTVQQIRRSKPAELNEETLKRLGVDTVEVLREHVRKDLEQTAEREQHAQLMNGIAGWLMQNTLIDDLPESVVDDELRSTIHNIVYDNARHGIPRDVIEERKGEIFDQASKTSRERIKLRYILERVASREHIEADKGEVDQFIAALAMRRQSTPDKVRAELEGRGGLNMVRQEIRARKVMDFLLEKAKVNETTEAANTAAGGAA